MSHVDSKPIDRVARRWGFYAQGRLAFAGLARQIGAREISVRLIETEHHAHTAPLPQRISREQLIRECARADIEQALGPDWTVRFQFNRRKLSETRLLRVVFRAAPATTEIPSHPSAS